MGLMQPRCTVMWCLPVCIAVSPCNLYRCMTHVECWPTTMLHGASPSVLWLLSSLVLSSVSVSDDQCLSLNHRTLLNIHITTQLQIRINFPIRPSIFQNLKDSSAGCFNQLDLAIVIFRAGVLGLVLSSLFPCICFSMLQLLIFMDSFLFISETITMKAETLPRTDTNGSSGPQHSTALQRLHPLCCLLQLLRQPLVPQVQSWLKQRQTTRQKKVRTAETTTWTWLVWTTTAQRFSTTSFCPR